MEPLFLFDTQSQAKETENQTHQPGEWKLHWLQGGELPGFSIRDDKHGSTASKSMHSNLKTEHLLDRRERVLYEV